MAAVKSLRNRDGNGRRRLLSFSAAVLIGAGVLTGCTAPGSALVVGNTSVSQDTLAQRSAALVAETASGSAAPSLDAANRQQATQLIRQQLIQQAAAALGVSVTDADVNKQLAQASGQQLATALGAPVSDVRQATTDALLLVAIVQKLPAAGTPVSDVDVTYDVVPATTRDQAVALRARYLADPSAMDRDAASSGKADQKETAVANTSDGAYGIFQASVGQILIIPSSSGYEVFRVKSRAVAKATLNVASFSALQSLPAIIDLGALLLQPYAARTDVSVNPRYGVWDPLTLQVVPRNDGL